jgi:hypothetical protein
MADFLVMNQLLLALVLTYFVPLYVYADPSQQLLFSMKTEDIPITEVSVCLTLFR